MGKFKENWQIVLFASVISLLSAYFLNKIQARDSHIDNAASTQYVDERDNKIITQFSTEDAKLQKQINEKADYQLVKDMNDRQIIMDARIYDLWKERKK